MDFRIYHSPKYIVQTQYFIIYLEYITCFDIHTYDEMITPVSKLTYSSPCIGYLCACTCVCVCVCVVYVYMCVCVFVCVHVCVWQYLYPLFSGGTSVLSISWLLWTKEWWSWKHSYLYEMLPLEIYQQGHCRALW